MALMLALILVISGGTAFGADREQDHSNHYSLARFVNWGKYVNKITWWYDQEGEDDFTEMIITAAEAWNETPTSINMTQVGNRKDSILRIYSDDYGDTGWYAKFNPFPDIHIGINEHYYLDEDQWEIIIAHEMGHAHGLDHYDECDMALMNSNPLNREDCHPYIGDIAGINAKYD